MDSIIQENLKTFAKWFMNQQSKLAELEEENRKLKEERDNFMLKYAKAVEEKVVETNKLCTERDKWRGKYNRLKSEFNLLKNKIWTTQK